MNGDKFQHCYYSLFFFFGGIYDNLYKLIEEWHKNGSVVYVCKNHVFSLSHVSNAHT